LTILSEVHASHTAIITLDRPQARNAWSEEMIAAFVSTLERHEADPAVRVLIITGAGSAFCAGGDLKLMKDHAGMFAGDAYHLRQRYRRGIQRIPALLDSFDKPIIAAVNGAAIGAGLDLACMCDIRVASARAKFGQTFPRLGLVPGDGGGYLLQRIVGFPLALELGLTGDVIKADRALEIGLVGYVVPPEDLLDTALEIAARIARNAPQAVALTKRAIYRARHQTMAQALETAATFQGIVQNTADHDEGVAALLEKRDPNYDNS
jgi:2-(1,2-epoxy-1,2-dihydrophenyl)acetyl-CoA isomerase